jgi:UDP-N-acetylglucosamine--dolichyl-phosphate N-acetylglucosaminephosphotransferase
MVNFIVLIPIMFSFIVTILFVPSWIERAKLAGLVGKDIHKTDEREVAESGGVTVVVGFSLGILVFVAINTFLFGSSENFVEIFALMSTILLIVFIAFTDDILGWKIGLRRRTRVILVAFASIPLIAINAGKSLISVPFMGPVDLGIMYPLVLIPLGIVGATTTYNFLAGFNGLEAGQGVILLSALSIVSFFTGSSWLAVIGLCMVLSLIAFMTYNFCPAEVFPGDTLTYAVGGLISIIAILGNFEKIAVFFFIPYILETVLKSRGKLNKESFGMPRKDGGLGLRYSKVYSLNHLSILIMEKARIKPTERKVVLSIWIFQFLIIVLGFIIFAEGIFG